MSAAGRDVVEIVSTATVVVLVLLASTGSTEGDDEQATIKTSKPASLGTLTLSLVSESGVRFLKPRTDLAATQPVRVTEPQPGGHR